MRLIRQQFNAHPNQNFPLLSLANIPEWKRLKKLKRLQTENQKDKITATGCVLHTPSGMDIRYGVRVLTSWAQLKMKRFWFIILAISFACEQQESKSICEIPPTDIEYGNAREYGYIAYTDVERVQECSEKTGRPILIMFTCWGCIANPDIPWKILQDEEVRNLVTNNYLLTTLYVDDKTPLPSTDTTKKTWRGKPIKTLGDKHSTFQRNRFDNYFQPFYAIVDHDLNELTPSIGYVTTEEKSKFIDFLKKGSEK